MDKTMIKDETLPQLLRHVQVEWGLSSSQMAALAQVSVETYEKWVQTEAPDQKSRVVCGGVQATVPPGMESAVPLIAIFRKLTARYPDIDEQLRWLFTANAEFGG